MPCTQRRCSCERCVVVSHDPHQPPEYILFICQIQERVPLAFPLHVLVCPTMLGLLFLESGLLLRVQTQVHPTQKERDEELHGQEYHDGDLPRNVRRGILRLEDLRADNVAHAKSRERYGINRNLEQLAIRDGDSVHRDWD